jgi:DNA invertase Pin-like site-specific DNA recombinase
MGTSSRVACYARYSSDLQRETPIEDQLTVAKRYAEERGWGVLNDLIYTDAAVSGASINGRAGVQRLLSTAAERPRPFDVVWSTTARGSPGTSPTPSG